MAVSIDIKKELETICKILKETIFVHSEESLVRRPRLGKKSADFSEQVDEAVSKCKVRYFCHFWLLLFCIAVALV